MLGWLDRFSVDLDFDFVAQPSARAKVQRNLEQVFARLGLTIKDKSQKVPQYFLKYPARSGERSTLKIDVTMPPPQANQYAPLRFTEIDRIITCQTIETMFANKLVALGDRYEKTKSIAGRDVYDIHYFFLRGFRYNAEVIKERTGQSLAPFFRKSITFINTRITDTILTQDLGTLLPYERFTKIRKALKSEVLMFLKDELQRIVV